MLILLDCMESGLCVERDGCDGSNGFGCNQGSSPSFCDAFLTNRAQNRPLQVVLQDVLIHLQDPLFSYRNRPKAYGVIWTVVWSLGKVSDGRNKEKKWLGLTQNSNRSGMMVGVGHGIPRNRFWG